jgi:hypothetical protein
MENLMPNISIQAYLQGYLQKTASGKHVPFPRQPNETPAEYSRRRLIAREGIYPVGHDPKVLGSLYKDIDGADTLPYGVKYTPDVQKYLAELRVPDPRTHSIDLSVMQPLVDRQYAAALAAADRYYQPTYGAPDEDVRHAIASKIYQMGEHKSRSQFTNFRQALNAGNTSEAIREAYFGKPDKDTGARVRSKWYNQTPVRVNDLRDMLLEAARRRQQATPQVAPQVPPQVTPPVPVNVPNVPVNVPVGPIASNPKAEPAAMAQAYIQRTDRTPESDARAAERLPRLYMNQGANAEAARKMTERFLGPQKGAQ